MDIRVSVLLYIKTFCVQPRRAKEKAAERNEAAMAPLIRRNGIIYFPRGGSGGPTRGIGGASPCQGEAFPTVCDNGASLAPSAWSRIATIGAAFDAR